MKCDKCRGIGNIVKDTMPEGSGDLGVCSYRLDPCPQCHGSGIVACCEGICEQPEASDAVPEAFRLAKQERDDGWPDR